MAEPVIHGAVCTVRRCVAMQAMILRPVVCGDCQGEFLPRLPSSAPTLCRPCRDKRATAGSVAGKLERTAARMQRLEELRRKFGVR